MLNRKLCEKCRAERLRPFKAQDDANWDCADFVDCQVNPGDVLGHDAQQVNLVQFFTESRVNVYGGPPKWCYYAAEQVVLGDGNAKS